MTGGESTIAVTIAVREDGSIALIDAAESKLVKFQNVSVGVGKTAKDVASSFGLVGANLNGLGPSIFYNSISGWVLRCDDQREVAERHTGGHEGQHPRGGRRGSGTGP